MEMFLNIFRPFYSSFVEISSLTTVILESRLETRDYEHDRGHLFGWITSPLL